jgi:hypothetical protein
MPTQPSGPQLLLPALIQANSIRGVALVNPGEAFPSGRIKPLIQPFKDNMTCPWGASPLVTHTHTHTHTHRGPHLLDVGCQLGEGLCVGQDGQGRVSQEAGVPHAHHAQEHRQVLQQGCVTEVVVHVICACANTFAMRCVFPSFYLSVSLVWGTQRSSPTPWASPISKSSPKMIFGGPGHAPCGISYQALLHLWADSYRPGNSATLLSSHALKVCLVLCMNGRPQ